MTNAEEYYREKNNCIHIVLSLRQKNEISNMELYHKTRINSISDEDINKGFYCVEGSRFTDGAKWLKNKLLSM